MRSRIEFGCQEAVEQEAWSSLKGVLREGDRGCIGSP